MNLLILGGTAFLGRHISGAALAAGHDVTLFHRGQTNPDIFPEATHILGDRTKDLDKLSDGNWDAVIDTSGYHPSAVRASAKAMADKVGTYVFISTISVYAGFATPNQDESAPLARLQRPSRAQVTDETYGALKTHCEDVVLNAFGERALILRPGLIVGPYDPTDRFTYWPARVQRGGEVLAPGVPTGPVQFIDARDIADWLLTLLDAENNGIFNVTGPQEEMNFSTFLDACKKAIKSDVNYTWVTPDFLAQHEVIPFQEMPLWVPVQLSGLITIDCTKAFEAGLTCRPVKTTITDTLAWYKTLPDDYRLRAGLTPAREQELLTAWHNRIPFSTRPD